ncbi:hypothetical protein FCULG_00002135, partial [Fusarium culmorum]
MSQTTDAFPLASEVYNDAPSADSGTDAGAAGDSSGNSVSISQGGMIAIVIVVVVVSLVGISTAALFFIAKKREWTMRETLRKSARKVVTALTPRRTEFPSSVKDGPIPTHRNRTRIDDDVPQHQESDLKILKKDWHKQRQSGRRRSGHENEQQHR